VTQVTDEMIQLGLDELGVSDLGAVGAAGGQKAVRKVTDGTKDLVMKVIALTPSAPDALRRAEREVDLLAKLTSPHVVRVESTLRELGEPPVAAGWLEEYLEGEDLTPLLGSPWAWTNVAQMGLQVADGLAAGHAVGVIHRDLSSNNVRRLADGTFKVLDFGFARHTLLSGITVAGQPGTRGFLSPEHLNSYSGGPMPSSDVFCVGILMFAALTGQPPIPWLGDDDDYLRRLAAVRLSADLATVRPDLTSAQVALISRCLHPQPARRFTTGTQLRDAIGALS
jgi:serine/threonine-protein kinase